MLSIAWQKNLGKFKLEQITLWRADFLEFFFFWQKKVHPGNRFFFFVRFNFYFWNRNCCDKTARASNFHSIAYFWWLFWAARFSALQMGLDFVSVIFFLFICASTLLSHSHLIRFASFRFCCYFFFLSFALSSQTPILKRIMWYSLNKNEGNHRLYKREKERKTRKNMWFEMI